MQGLWLLWVRGWECGLWCGAGRGGGGGEREALPAVFSQGRELVPGAHRAGTRGVAGSLRIVLSTGPLWGLWGLALYGLCLRRWLTFPVEDPPHLRRHGVPSCLRIVTGQVLLHGLCDIPLPGLAELPMLQSLQLTQGHRRYLRHLEFAYAVCEPVYLLLDRVLLWSLALLLLLLLAAAMLAGSVAWLSHHCALLPRPSRDVLHAGLGLFVHGHVGEGSGLVHVRGSPLAHAVNARHGQPLLHDPHLVVGRHYPKALGLHETHGDGPGNVPPACLGCILRRCGIGNVDVPLERHTRALRLQARHAAINAIILHMIGWHCSGRH